MSSSMSAFFAPILPRDDLNAATAEQEKEYAAKLAAWVNYISPVKGAKEELEKSDPDIANNPVLKITRRLFRVTDR